MKAFEAEFLGQLLEDRLGGDAFLQGDKFLGLTEGLRVRRAPLTGPDILYGGGEFLRGDIKFVILDFNALVLGKLEGRPDFHYCRKNEGQALFNGKLLLLEGRLLGEPEARKSRNASLSAALSADCVAERMMPAKSPWNTIVPRASSLSFPAFTARSR